MLEIEAEALCRNETDRLSKQKARSLEIEDEAS